MDELLAIDIDKEVPDIIVDSAKVFSEDYIKIGAILPYGKDDQFASQLFASMSLAAEEINEQGGILGKKSTLFQQTMQESKLSQFNRQKH